MENERAETGRSNLSRKTTLDSQALTTGGQGKIVDFRPI